MLRMCSTCTESPHNPGGELCYYLHPPNGPLGLREGARPHMGGPAGHGRTGISCSTLPGDVQVLQSSLLCPPGKSSRAWWAQLIGTWNHFPKQEELVRPGRIRTGLRGPHQLKVELLFPPALTSEWGALGSGSREPETSGHFNAFLGHRDVSP